MKIRPGGVRGWIFLLLRLAIIPSFIIAGLMYITRMPGSSYSNILPPLSPKEQILCDHLKEYVYMLAKTIGERNIWNDSNLEASARYIEKVLSDAGYEVTAQEFVVENVIVRNIEAEIIGTLRPEEIVLIGAHYDSFEGSPGADDNASGVAALLEIAGLLAYEKPARTVRFVFFVNEEPPFFQAQDMGSRVYASRSRQRGENIAVMISLESLGYYSDEVGSQHYPPPFSFFYPKTANFIGFVSNLSSRQMVRKSIEIFRKNTAFPSEGVAAPVWIVGVDWSDHWSFWKEGYPAFMITDTALYRYSHYHSQYDTPDRLDYARMTRVVEGITQIIRELTKP